MPTQSISRKKQKIHTFGCPHHGLNVNGTLTLSNGDTIYKPINGSKRRYGDCYQIEVPGHTYADPVTFPSHLKFESYALSSGFEYKSLYNTKIGYGDKKSFIYCDTNKDRWKVTINPAVGGTATAITLTLTLRKFGDFVNTDDEFYTYTLNVGNPAITTALNGYVYEVVNVSKTGNLAIIGLCLENSTTESQSTCIFDRQYGYPLAFIRLDLTDKNTQTASIYRSKTYCERKPAKLPGSIYNATWLPKTTLHIINEYDPVTKNLTKTTKIWGEKLGFLCFNSSLGYNYDKLPSLPETTYIYNKAKEQWGWEGFQDGGTPYNFRVTIGSIYGGEGIPNYRLIHVFINDDNSLVDVECLYKNASSGNISLKCTTSIMKSWSDVSSLADSLVNNISDNRTIVRVQDSPNIYSGQATISINNYSTSKTGQIYTYSLVIGGSICSSVSFRSLTNTKIDNVEHINYNYLNMNPTNKTIYSSTYSESENIYTGPTSGTITAVPLTSYKNYKGWMSKGTYTIDGNKYVTPYIQLYTNNLVGMIEGNGLTSNPDNAHWDTGSGGNHIAMQIFNKNGVVVSSGGTIDALSRYCSWQPKTGEFSGLYNVPVCYV